MDFTSNYDVIPKYYYSTIFIDRPQVVIEVYQTKKLSRGPPYFIV